MSTYTKGFADDTCRFDVGKANDIRQSNLDHLAMLKARAKRESGSFGFLDFLKLAIFVGIISTFAVVFYRIQCLQQNITVLKGRLDYMELQSHTNPHYLVSGTPEEESRGTKNPFGRDGHDRRPDYMSRWYPRHQEFNGTADRLFKRSRRSASGSNENNGHSGSSRGDTNSISSQMPEFGEHFAQHLLPFETNMTVKKGYVFKWREQTEPSAFRKNAGFELLVNQYLRAPVSGFYFIYSQITYEDRFSRTIGHQIVSFGNCGDGDMKLLMGTSITQQGPRPGALGTRPRDSAYVGGVAYLSAGDLVAVRPELGVTNALNVTRTDMNTFFGSFLISKDKQAPPIEEICPHGQ